MSYLRHEWDNYRYHDWRLSLFMMAVTEDVVRWLRLPWQVLRPIWFLRGRLTEGKSRRLLRRFVRHWAKTGNFSQSYFYDREHGRKDCLGQIVVVTVEWKEFSQ